MFTLRAKQHHKMTAFHYVTDSRNDVGYMVLDNRLTVFSAHTHVIKIIIPRNDGHFER